MRTLTAQRRDADGVDLLHGCVLRRVEAAGETTHVIDTPEEWFTTLTDLFHLDLADPGVTTRTRLRRKIRAAHEDWAAPRGSCLTAAQ